jgi:hypothetical protein
MELNPRKEEDNNNHKPKRRLPVKGLIAYMLAGLLTFGGLYTYQHSDSHAMRDLIITLDKFGITEIAAQERSRIQNIKRLNIPYEKKLVLMNRNVFMGANKQMVFLALGNPRMAGKNVSKSGANVEQWIYYMANDNRPTILEFTNNELISAYRGSNIDFQFARR